MQKRLAIGRGVKNLDLKICVGTPPASLKVNNTVSHTILVNANCYTDKIAPNASLNYSGKCQQLVWATGDSKDGHCTSFSPCTSCTSHLAFQLASLAELVGLLLCMTLSLDR